jgi:glycosyltransferase involved in cell wall biosynthesis
MQAYICDTSRHDRYHPKTKVLIVTSLFFPEIAANSIRMTALAEKLSEEGSDVTVVTAFPYCSSASGHVWYKSKLVAKESYNGINIVRTYTFVPKKSTIYKRFLTFLTYMFSSTVYSIFTRKKFDIVVCISPPFFSLMTALIMSKIRHTPFIIDIQDLYPDTAIELGKLKNNLLIRIWRAIETTIYKNASAIIVISQGFKSEIIKKGINSNKIFVINSWVNTNRFHPEKVPNRKKTLGLADYFVVLFLGTIGYAQGAENIVETAAMVSKHKKIKFLFIGGGVEKNRIMQKTQDAQIDNVLFLPPQPFEKIPSFINAADVCLVSLVRRRLYEITIPCKTYEYLAMGKPIIMAAKGEAASLIRDNNCGIVTEPECPEALRDAVLDIYNDPQEAERLSKNSRLAALKYSEKVLLPEYKKLICQICNGGLSNE